MTKSNYDVTDNIDKTKVYYMPIPYNSSNRVGKQIPRYIIIHEVSPIFPNQLWDSFKNPNLTTTKENDLEKYTNQIINNGKRGSLIGWHYTVDDNKIIQHLEDTVATNHTGTKYFNSCSIGIERLVNENVNFPDALHNQAKLIATLMKKWNIPISNVLTHEDTQIITKRKILIRLELIKEILNKIENNNKITKQDISLIKKYIYPLKMYNSNNKEKVDAYAFSKTSTEEFINNILLCCDKNNINFKEFTKNIESNINNIYKIINDVIPKKCPGRAIAEKYNGVNELYKEIELCYFNNDFFEEVFMQLSYDDTNKTEVRRK